MSITEERNIPKGAENTDNSTAWSITSGFWAPKNGEVIVQDGNWLETQFPNGVSNSGKIINIDKDNLITRSTNGALIDCTRKGR
jgi:hypothetical protein